MSSLYFVIAGNHQQFEHFRRNDMMGYDKYVYVSDVSYLKGYRNPKGVFTGTWYERRDIDDIITQLCISTDNSQSIAQIRKAIDVVKEIRYERIK